MALFPDLSGWQLVVITLFLTHITIAAVTIFLHREQSHKTLKLSPVPSHFFRFWLWLTTGMVTKEWVAIHRKHHAKCETEEDPHSPQVKGLNKVLWLGAWLYRQESINTETLERYGKGTPDDWVERNIYSRHPSFGVTFMLLIDVLLFGWVGLAIWAVQMIWIPFWAAGVINGVGHFWGYRNWNTSDASRNIAPWGILIGGEELHNNHHAFASSAKLSSKWYEFDIGWMYIRILEMLKMADVKKVAPTITINTSKPIVDNETVTTVLGNRLQVLSHFAKQVMNPVFKDEYNQTSSQDRKFSKDIRSLLTHSQPLDFDAKEKLQKAFQESQVLETVYNFQQRLQQLWENTSVSQEVRIKALQEWINHAEESNIQKLQEFAQRLRGYSLVR